MSIREVVAYIWSGLVGALIYFMFLFWFGWAVWKGVFLTKFSVIRGNAARAIGIIGVIGTTAGAYLALGSFVFNTNLPFESVASLLFCLFVIALLIVTFLSLFTWREK